MTPCFECDEPAAADHHVVPRVLGGTKTVPLCKPCHAKVHDMRIATLQRAGIERARDLGRYGGRREDPYRAGEMKRMGYSAAEIAESLGVSAGTVYRYLRQNKQQGD